MKKEVTILVIGLLVIGGIFVFSKKNYSQKPDQNATTTPIVQNTGVKVAPIISEYSSTTYTSIALNYPKSSESELSEVFLTVRDIKNDFIKAYAGITKEQAAEMYITAENPYEIIINTKVEKSSKTVTYVIYSYEYTGGAHGGTSVYTFTYDENNKLVKEKDVFEDNYLYVISPMARDYFYINLGEYKNPAMIDPGTLPNYENFRSWYLTDDTVVFIFGQYQIGPYVLGIQEYRIDKAKIQNILKPAFK